MTLAVSCGSRVIVTTAAVLDLHNGLFCFLNELDCARHNYIWSFDDVRFLSHLRASLGHILDVDASGLLLELYRRVDIVFRFLCELVDSEEHASDAVDCSFEA